MHKMRKKTIRNGITVIFLLFIAFCCRYINIIETFYEESNAFVHVVYPTFKSIIRHMIHITLVLAWCMSLRSRILDKGIRNHMMAVGGLIILWFLIRVCKWEFVFSYEETIVRYLWYGFYISIVLLPLQGVFIADLAGRSEDEQGSGWLKWMYVPASLLILIVFTNDWHHLVFSFPDGTINFNLSYKHEILYFVILAWVVVLTIWFMVSLMGKNHISGDTKYRKLIYVILIGFVVVWFIHTWELLPNDQTVLNCMLIILLLESQIQTGLIRSNSNYDQLFQKSTIAAQIIDNSDKAHYVSGSAINIDPELLKKAEDGFIQNGDMLFHRKPISGGYVLWQDNIRELRLILEKLQETREQLGETYELKKAEVDLKERRFHAEEKNRLYNRIAREVSPQLVTVDTFLAETIKHPEREKELLARVCVVSAYIKRLSNLILISEEKKEVSFGELESCLRESLDNIRLMGILTFLDFRCEDQILAEEAIGIYRLFENLIEQLLDKMNALIITLECQNRKMDLCIQVGCKANVGEIQMPEYSLQGIRLSYEIQEEDVVFHILLRGEAEADDELL